ncbi:hypothetical protein [Streptomyces sp. NPDC058045]|uniref:hypothetical protein n=1 Tax=Streptomyces sp. NPDC058045 TaxID=3346311 RepID=UPI0036E69705
MPVLVRRGRSVDGSPAPNCTVSADGSYAARLTRADRDGTAWYPERWTLDGPEPYAVPLPGRQPEAPGAGVLPMSDGRVLVHRPADGRHHFALLYPTGPRTGEVPLGVVPGGALRLLPPAPGGCRAYALVDERGATAVWLVAGGPFGPERVAEVPGRCGGGAWLDRAGRLLAVDRESEGRIKTVVVDLGQGGVVSPLLQLTEDSTDRLLLADADSGLLLIRSDAPSPGRERLGWGVLGSTLPVRFPDCLRPAGCTVTPFAIQPGQVLTPESCAVALRITPSGGPREGDGSGGWLGLWRPAERTLHQLPAPDGWLTGTGVWDEAGVLRLPYSTAAVPCGLARVPLPGRSGTRAEGSAAGQATHPGTATGVLDTPSKSGDSMTHEPGRSGQQPVEDGAGDGGDEVGGARPVPLQQAPLTGREDDG